MPKRVFFAHFSFVEVSQFIWLITPFQPYSRSTAVQEPSVPYFPWLQRQASAQDERDHRVITEQYLVEMTRERIPKPKVNQRLHNSLICIMIGSRSPTILLTKTTVLAKKMVDSMTPSTSKIVDLSVLPSARSLCWNKNVHTPSTDRRYLLLVTSVS